MFDNSALKYSYKPDSWGLVGEENGQRGMEGWINGCKGGGVKGVFSAPAERVDSSL